MTFRILFPLEDNTFISWLFRIWTTTTNRLPRFNTYFFNLRLILNEEKNGGKNTERDRGDIRSRANSSSKSIRIEKYEIQINWSILLKIIERRSRTANRHYKITLTTGGAGVDDP